MKEGVNELGFRYLGVGRWKGEGVGFILFLSICDKSRIVDCNVNNKWIVKLYKDIVCW